LSESPLSYTSFNTVRFIRARLPFSFKIKPAAAFRVCAFFYTSLPSLYKFFDLDCLSHVSVGVVCPYRSGAAGADKERSFFSLLVPSAPELFLL